MNNTWITGGPHGENIIYTVETTVCTQKTLFHNRYVRFDRFWFNVCSFQIDQRTYIYTLITLEEW